MVVARARTGVIQQTPNRSLASQKLEEIDARNHDAVITLIPCIMAIDTMSFYFL
jgi:hypothetical protein